MSDETPGAPPPPTPTRPPSALTNPKDAAARPGFRSPPNQRTKAQKAPQGKKK
jgi:hypothetical protein